MANSTAGGGGVEAIRHLTSASPPLYLSPSPSLSLSARLASHHLFSSLKPYSPKSPFDHLLIEGFDAEQIWQQIDIQSQPLIASLRRHVKNLEKTPPEEFRRLFGDDVVKERKPGGLKDKVLAGIDDEERENDGLEEKGSSDFDDDDVDNEEEEEESGGEENRGVEDKFLKMKEMESYMRADERREYGTGKSKSKKKRKTNSDEDDEEEEDEDGDLNFLGADLGNEEEDELGNARYEDFFGSEKNNNQKRKPDLDDESEDSDMYGEDEDDEVEDEENDDEEEDEEEGEQKNENKKQNLSTHEKEQQKLRAKIDQMEQANLEPKHWCMQGEVTAAKRPKNSALEVDLDFEHNVRPPPVITEEYTADIEELIKKRILEGKFDEVQKVPSLQLKAPKEYKEMDENKSQKGLATIYEDEYVQKTGLVSVAVSFSDEQKKEASMLFKKLCLKLDALSHFHFTPKPVLEDMSIQANVPALAMEEIAPVAVSDAAMLAPEEVYAGKGEIKEETELTQAERRRRRANKKRKFKVETAKKTALKKARESTMQKQNDDKEES